jgi:glutamate N-acetyltransferase/amino-acid N-acetyltransferase
MRHPDYQEPAGASYLKGHEIEIRVDAGTGGPGRATVWASDLTHDYIAINADYRS